MAAECPALRVSAFLSDRRLPVETIDFMRKGSVIMTKIMRPPDMEIDRVKGLLDEAQKRDSWGNDSPDLMELASRLEIQQLKRRILKGTRDDLEASAGLTDQQNRVFQHRFDEITRVSMVLANEAARRTASNPAELRAKAAFVLEFAEVHERDVVNRLTLSLVTELITYLDSELERDDG